MAQITKDTIIGEILNIDETTAPFFLDTHFQVADDILRLLHTAFPHQMAGEFSRSRFYDVVSIRAECIQILLGGDVYKRQG